MKTQVVKMYTLKHCEFVKYTENQNVKMTLYKTALRALNNFGLVCVLQVVVMLCWSVLYDTL